ncbi:MotA/TolQ/ExbB proton channel family protein [bacterium]|nr:MotA/TolQ/ExbB proton channel family protein [bacterium]
MSNETIPTAATTNEEVPDVATTPELSSSSLDGGNNVVEATSASGQVPSDTADATGLWNIEHIQSLFEAGGPVIMILAVMSLITMSIFLMKCWQFFWVGLNRHKTIQASLRCWHAQQYDDAITLLKKTKNPIARVLETAMSLKVQYCSDNPLFNEMNNPVAREEATRIAKRELANARSHLKTLEIIATLSPLLGLLGTVLGMITAFQKLQGAGSTIDPALLSGGIWEALLTTAAGLIVAIPTVVALNALEQRIDRFKLVLEDTLTQVFTAGALQVRASEIDVKHDTKTSPSHHKVKNTEKNADLALASS